MLSFLCFFSVFFINDVYCKVPVGSDLIDHTMVTHNDVFPYMAAILKKNQYISAGALINEKWVLTAADSLFFIWDCLAQVSRYLKGSPYYKYVMYFEESSRLIQVRLGSVNYKRGGVLLPVKQFQIHPYFDDNRPQYDLAMVELSQKISVTPSRSPIRWEKSIKAQATTHYIVTAWPATFQVMSVGVANVESMETIKRRRMLTVSHLHPSSQIKCENMLEKMGPNATEALMCLDPDGGVDSCLREVGAPVVLNGILQGIISSYKPENCPVNPSIVLANKISSKDHKSWILSTIHGHRWVMNEDYIDYEEKNTIETKRWF